MASRASATYLPTASPSASSSFLAKTLSIAAALANTPGPTYGSPPISSRPWMVPSSPHAPCSSGKTTSTSCNAWPGSTGTRSVLLRSVGRLPAPDSSALGSVPSAHCPCGVMPTGTTSKRSASRYGRTLLADWQETSCSELRPPKTTATLVLRCVMGPDPTRLGDCPY